MIHSLAGGEIKEQKIVSIAKVLIENTKEEWFYIFEDKTIKLNDFVLVPFGKIDEPTKAQVLKIIKDVNLNNFPNSKHLKKIYKKI